MKTSASVGRAGMVPTQHDLAVEASLDILDAGGTAADGAVAAAAVPGGLTVDAIRAADHASVEGRHQ